MHTRHKHTTSAWQNTHTSHTWAPTAPRLTILTENTTSITSTTQTHLNTLKAKITIFNNGRYTTNIPTVTTTDIKTNMCHIHTSPQPDFTADLQRIGEIYRKLCSTSLEHQRKWLETHEGDSPLQHDYKHRVLGEPSDICTDCGASPQDVRHLVACTTHPNIFFAVNFYLFVTYN